MRRIYSPVLLANLPEARARAFVVLFTFDAIARSILISVLPLKAYGLLGAAQLVSIAYFAAAFLGLGTNLSVPLLLRTLPRRWVLTIGAGIQVASVALLSLESAWTFVLGLAMQGMAMAMLDVAINLYMLDHIPRRELNTFEPRRLLFTGTTFALGPWLGVYLNGQINSNLAFVVAGMSALSLLTFFWFLRLSDHSAVRTSGAQSPSPLKSIPRFVAQPRLLLSWCLALGRNGWWVMNFIYVPIYVTRAGYGPEAGGALVSLGLVAMLGVRMWGRLGQKIGIRNVLSIGYGCTGVLSLIAAALAMAEQTTACMVALWAAAVAATIIDGAGNVPFLRAVHHYERAEMTSVFMTFRHVGSLVVPGVLALVLWVAPFPAVFATGGLLTLGMALLSRLLPRGL
ncbi:MAG: MFS transporter [Hyphomicrobiaceae bacterium]